MLHLTAFLLALAFFLEAFTLHDFFFDFFFAGVLLFFLLLPFLLGFPLGFLLFVLLLPFLLGFLFRLSATALLASLFALLLFLQPVWLFYHSSGDPTCQAVGRFVNACHGRWCVSFFLLKANIFFAVAFVHRPNIFRAGPKRWSPRNETP